MIEIFSHDVSAGVDPDTDDIFILKGKTWENEAFILYLNKTEAENVLWQLNFVVSEAGENNRG